MTTNTGTMRPLSVSVVVLTRDRSALLRRCLRSICRQDLAPDQIIVVDNGSRDASPDMVRSEFPDLELIENAENLGIAGRNIGCRAATGDVILSLDDDVELIDCTMIRKLLDFMQSDPSTAAVTLKLCEETTGDEFPEHHWWHPLDRRRFQDTQFETDRINEAAVAFRSEALARVGYYYEPLFWGGEEWDLVLGLLDAGYSIRYLPIPVKHLAPRGSLNSRADPRQALLIRNRFWIALRRLSPAQAFVFIVPRFFLWFSRSIRFGYLNHYLAGLAGLLRNLPVILRDRRPISPQTRRRLRSIRAGSARRRWELP